MEIQTPDLVSREFVFMESSMDETLQRLLRELARAGEDPFLLISDHVGGEMWFDLRSIQGIRLRHVHTTYGEVYFKDIGNDYGWYSIGTMEEPRYQEILNKWKAIRLLTKVSG